MIKAVLIGISVFVGCFTTIFFSRYIDYKWSASQIKNKQNQTLLNYTQLYLNGSFANVNYNESHPVLKSLTKLIEIPLIGQFFMDEKIHELAKLHHWQAIAHQSEYIVQTAANKYCYAVWYHKALAECMLRQLDKCEDSIKTLQLLAGGKVHRYYTDSLYQELKDLRRGKSRSQLQILQQL